jgi:hypothetical protein
MIYFDVDNVDIPFNPDWTSISISLSGGADSALLGYILCDLINTHCSHKFTVNIISHTRMWKTKPWQGFDSLRVFNWLQDKFTDIKFKRHTNFISPELEWGTQGPTIVDEYGKLVSGDNIEIRAFAEYVCFHENVDAYYNAVTRNPRNVDFKGMPTRDIDLTDDNQHLSVTMHMGKFALHPFRFIEKDWIIKQYRRLDINELLEITRSCEGEFKHINYTNYVPGQYVPTCNECFWCKERAWAYEKA